MSDINPTFAGEVQLAGWSETHTGGCKVTFWLQTSEDLDAFRALTVRKGNTAGHRFMVALVEVGDDEQPVQQPTQPKGGALARLAAQLCADEEFWFFVGAKFGDVISHADQCALWMRCQCEIRSRAELDSNEEAADHFHEFIRKPWLKWRADKGMK